MKSLLKKILPWHLRQSLAWARFFYGKRKPTFQGTYSRFDQAPAGPVWRARPWTESSRVHAEKWRHQIGKAIPESMQPSKALLPLLAASFGAGRPGRTIRILDFGGAGGIDYAHLLAALGDSPGLDIRYHVVDMPESCEAGKKVWGDDPRISFSPELPDASERFDIVYAFCSLFLVEDFRGLLETLSGYRPSLMLFCKTPIHEGPSFVRRQVNLGKEMENPQWVLGLGDLIEVMEKNGYSLTYRGHGEDSYNVDNYDAAHQVGRMTNILFARRSP
jgi:putative methyltransferase (TIGR04325 family)